MATVEAVDALAERLRLAEGEIIKVKAMEVPNLTTLQTLVETIAAKVKTIEEQMGTFGAFVNRIAQSQRRN